MTGNILFEIFEVGTKNGASVDNAINMVSINFAEKCAQYVGGDGFDYKQKPPAEWDVVAARIIKDNYEALCAAYMKQDKEAFERIAQEV